MTNGGVPLSPCRVNLCQLIIPQWDLLSLFSHSVWVLATTKYVKEEGKINWVKVFVWNVEETPRNGRKKILVGSDQPRGTHHLLSPGCFMWGYWQCCIGQTHGHFNHTELPSWGWNPSFSFLCELWPCACRWGEPASLGGRASPVLRKSTTLRGVTHCLMSRRLCTKPIHNRLNGMPLIKWPF